MRDKQTIREGRLPMMQAEFNKRTDHAAMSAAEPVGYLVPRGDVAGPDNEYYSFCEDQGSAAAEADIYDKGYFPIYTAPNAPPVAVKAELPERFEEWWAGRDSKGEKTLDYNQRKQLAWDAFYAAALAAQVQDVTDMPQSPWPASDWAIGRIKELEAQAIPEGWQLVPKVLTPEMAAELNLTGTFSDAAMQVRYAAALAKSPAATTTKESGE